jgi:Xaa-Pro aminopeptidase
VSLTTSERAESQTLARFPLARAELERRWDALRRLLREHDCDAAVTQAANTQSCLGGYFRWITGAAVPAGYPRSVVFPAAGGMTLVSHGSFGGDIASDASNAESPGVERRLTAPMFPMVNYTATFDADCILLDLRERAARRVAVLGPTSFTHGFGRQLAAENDIEWVDLTDEIDQLKARKSAVEIELIRAAAAMQDRLMATAREIIRPGVHEYEIAAELQRRAVLAGSLGGLILTTSGSLDRRGQVMFPRTPDLQARQLQAGDVVVVLIENAGPGGMVTHIGRMFSLGPVPAGIDDAHDLICIEQDALAAALLPGAAPAELFASYNARMRSRGRAEETRVHAHGQGYEIVERPLIRSDETMLIAPNMNIGIHPMVVERSILVTAIDNYLTGPSAAERLHRTPRTIVDVCS